MSVLFALVAAIGWGSSDFAAGHASRRSSAVSVVILTHFAAVVALVVVSLVPGQGGSPTLADLTWGLAAGLGGGFGAMLLFRGLGKGSMAVVAPITATGAASIPVLAGVVQGDPITLFSVLGVLLALIAIIMVSLAGDDADADSDAAIAKPNRWAAPQGLPISTLPPALLAPSTARFAPSFAPPVAAPASVFAASAPLAQEMPRLPSPPVPAFPAPAHATSWLPAPLQHASLLAPPVSEPASVATTSAVALLDPPPASAPTIPIAPPASPPPPIPHAPELSPRAPSTAVAASDEPSALTNEADQAVLSPQTGESVSALDQLRSIVQRPGVVDALLSGIGFGLFFVFIARTAESAGHWPLVSARGISVVMFVLGALISRGAILPEKGSRKAVVLAGALDAAAALFFVLSTRDGLLSVGAVLASLYPAVTIVLARIISKEQIVKRQLVGLGLAALAVSLLAI